MTTKQKPPEGFFYFPDFITDKEEKTLIKNFPTLDWLDIVMYGVLAKRRVVHFGVTYNYDTRQAQPTIPPPKFLHGIIKRVAGLMKIPASDINEILITEYPIEAGIGWHKDSHVFGDKVFGISLSSPSVMKLRIKQADKYQIYKISLEPRSAYILSGPARSLWQHSIPAVKNKRYSITFRTLRDV